MARCHDRRSIFFSISARRYSTSGTYPHQLMQHIIIRVGVRLNHVNVQVLPERLQQAVFPDDNSSSKIDPRIVALSRAHLKKHELPIDTGRTPLLDVEIKVPKLVGNDIEEHFWKMGAVLGMEYSKLVESYILNVRTDIPLDRFKWDLDALGWSQYSLETGEKTKSLEYPDESVMVFDVETCKAYTDLKAPLLAVAMSERHLYTWISPSFIKDHSEVFNRDQLMPFGPSPKASLLVGHNVSFDRGRVLEEYQPIDEHGTYKRRYLDTLSLHSAVSGISSQQRIQWTKYKKDRNSAEMMLMDDAEEVDSLDVDTESHQQGSSSSAEHGIWCQKGSMANLADTVRLHCNGMSLDKSPRDLLLKETDPAKIKEALPLLMSYCASDVIATASLFKALWPKFKVKCPHPVTFTAMLEMTTCYLPITKEWSEYVERCESMLTSGKGRIEQGLAELAKRRLKEERPSDDPWLSKLDWTPVPEKYTKPRYKKDGTFAKGGEPRPIGNPELFGMPAWFRKLYNAQTGAVELTTKARIVPYLLKMSWEGYPVHFIANAGWCRAVRADSDSPNTVFFVDEAWPEYKFYKIPHAKEQGANVGCLLSKDYLSAYEKGTLTTHVDSTDIVKTVLELNSKFSFWTGYRERIREGQLVVWQDNEKERGVILPQCIPMGTVTRRAVEPTWMTASNPKPNLVGSELKAMVRSPPGWSIVGADVDSQELWIASLLGDAQFGFAGATAIGWMTLQGAKSDGTDLHSRTAKLLGMTRDAAKIFTYGRIYGAGANYAAQLIQKYDPTLDQKAASEKARTLYHATKGRKLGGEDPASRFYLGGTESFMFNQLESIARAEVSRTPALSAAISDALLSSSVQEDFLTSRINWAVQSSGVDYLHMLLVAMQYLTRLYNIPSRLLLTIHDEVRFLVPTSHQYRLAGCLQIANLWTRAMFVHRLGMWELPLSVAFFSAVDFDHVLRKEPGITCQTPSNTEVIPPGHSLDVYGLMEKLGQDGIGNPEQEFIRWWRSTSMQAKAMPSEYRQTILGTSGPNHLAYLRRQANLPKGLDGSEIKTHYQPRRTPSMPVVPVVEDMVASGAEAKMATAWKKLLRNQTPPKP